MQKRTLLIVVGVAALLAGLTYGFLPGAVLVETVAVTRGPLELTLSEEGETRLVRRFRVDAPLAGMVSRIDLEVGDPVAAGAPLATIEPSAAPLLDPRRRAEAEAVLARAQAAVELTRQEFEAAKAAASLARADHARLLDLYTRGDTSQAALEAAESGARRAEALERSAAFAVQVSEHERDAARAVLDLDSAEGGAPVAVSSPISGKVLKVYRESRGVVGPAEPLVEVGDVRSLEVQIDVLSSDAVRISEGMPVRFNRWGGPRPLIGEVTRVEPVGFTKISALGVEEQRVLVIARITSPEAEWQRLGDGYRVEAEFILWSGENVLQVPAGSLFRHGDGWGVFVVDDGTARLQEVGVGIRSGLRAEIVSGLDEGGPVVNHPPDELDDGRKVSEQ